MQDQSPSSVAKAEAAKQAVILIFAVLTMLFIMATTNPDFLKTWRMRAAAGSSRLLSFLSRKAGHTSMGIELTTGTQQYSLPYALSRLRDTATRIYNEESNYGS
jgi:hypothetical protein